MSFPSYKKWVETRCNDGEEYAIERADRFAEIISEAAYNWAYSQDIDRIIGFDQFLEELWEDLPEFSFPDFPKWCEDEYADALGGYEDFKHDEMRGN